MQSIRIIGLLSLLLLLPQCRNEENFSFKMSYFHEFQIGPTLNTFDTHFFIFSNTPTNVDSYFAASTADPIEATSIKPALGRLSAVFGDTNLIFIEDVEVGFFTNDPNDPADFQLAFYRDDIQSTRNGDIDLLPSLINLQPVLTQQRYNLCIKLKFFTSPPEFLDIRFNMEYGVTE